MFSTFKKPLIVLLLILVVLGGVLFPASQSIHAQTNDFVTGAFSAIGVAADYTIGWAILGISVIFKGIASLLLGMSVYLFDLILEFSIDTQNLEFEGGIKTGWTVVRDVANISFIFILLYIAFATILQLGNFNTKKILVNLIIVALLVNFSFFLAGAVIDTSNIFALLIYNELKDSDGNNIINDDDMTIGEQFSASLNIKSLFESETFGFLSSPTKRAVANFFGGIILFIAAFTFISGGLLMIFRTVALMFILVLSPIALAAAVLPQTNEHFKKWLKHLIHQSFVAPILFLMLLIILNIIRAGSLVVSENQSLSDAFTPSTEPGVFDVLLPFTLVIGLFIGGIILTRKFAGKTATFAMGAPLAVAGLAAGAALGGAALAGRATAGRLSARVAGSERLKNLEAHGGFAGRNVAAATRKFGEYGARASFDARSTRALDLVTQKSGVKFGSAKQGGREADQKERERKTKAKLDSIGKGSPQLNKGERKEKEKLGSDLKEAEANFAKLLGERSQAEQTLIRKALAGLRSAETNQDQGRAITFKKELERVDGGGILQAEQALAEARRSFDDFTDKRPSLGKTRQQAILERIENSPTSRILHSRETTNRILDNYRKPRNEKQRVKEFIKEIINEDKEVNEE